MTAIRPISQQEHDAKRDGLYEFRIDRTDSGYRWSIRPARGHTLYYESTHTRAGGYLVDETIYPTCLEAVWTGCQWAAYWEGFPISDELPHRVLRWAVESKDRQYISFLVADL